VALVISNLPLKPSAQPEVALFRTKGFGADWIMRADRGHPKAIKDLPPILRTLLVTDGTVTKCLEAYFWEPIKVEDVAQSMQTAEASIDGLGVLAGAQILARSVRLVGGHSGTHYATARSVVRLENIPATFREALLNGRIGIGELIRECGIETYRELQEIACTDRLPDQIHSVDDRGCVYRTYRILIGGLPALLVSEYFPVAIYHRQSAGAQTQALP
jgi:chorismate-pyruvate lyase